jgi:hypothetical protein
MPHVGAAEHKESGDQRGHGNRDQDDTGILPGDMEMLFQARLFIFLNILSRPASGRDAVLS